MSLTLSSLGEREPPLDYLIEYTQAAIKKQAATIDRLLDEGHEFTDATKHLNEMIENLASITLIQKRRTGG